MVFDSFDKESLRSCELYEDLSQSVEFSAIFFKHIGEFQVGAMLEEMEFCLFVFFGEFIDEFCELFVIFGEFQK